MKEQEFELKDILSVSTGNLVNGDFGKVRDIIDFIFDGNFYTLTTMSLQEPARKYLFEVDKKIRSATLDLEAELLKLSDNELKVALPEILGRLEKEYGEYFSIPQMDENARKEILDNLFDEEE